MEHKTHWLRRHIFGNSLLETSLYGETIETDIIVLLIL